MAQTTIAVLIALAALLPRSAAALDPKTPLDALSLPSDSFEVRVWVVSNLQKVSKDGTRWTPFKGFSIRRDASLWTGRYVDNGLIQSVEPRSEWHALWARLVALGLLTLPDSSQLPNPAPVTDGVSYVVEIGTQGHYRTYSYANPEHQKWPEAGRIIQIFKTLEGELLPKPWHLRWWWSPS